MADTKETDGVPVALEALKKREIRLLGENRPLDPWERYRALNDALSEAYDLMDLANREARLALLVMGALNAGLFLVGTRLDLLASLPDRARPWMAVGFFGYVIAALYFLAQAIETLRPRKFRPPPRPLESLGVPRPAGLRYHEDILARDPEAHARTWNSVRLSELNAELAAQTYSLALKNRAKYSALRRLFNGLRALSVLAVGLLSLLWIMAVLRT